MFDRRSVMLTLLGAAVAKPFHTAPLHAEPLWASQTPVFLWPDRPPDGPGPSESLHENARGAVRNISRPFLTVLIPEKPNGAAMLIAAGGGYKRVENGIEALPAARWLISLGVTAFVLTYRLPGELWQNPPLAPFQDAQRALRLIRASAPQYRLDRNRIGVLGFSAGGHLLGLASTRADFQSYAAVDSSDDQSAQPNFTALIYPVITLQPPYDHTSTRHEMIGDHPTPEAAAEWSVQTYVGGHSPPMFLAQAADDPIANPANTAILEGACLHAGVPVERHLFSSGGHGFGMGRPNTASTQWPGLCQSWLEKQRIV